MPGVCDGCALGEERPTRLCRRAAHPDPRLDRGRLANEGQTVLVDDKAPNVKACLAPDVDAYHDAATKVFAAAS